MLVLSLKQGRAWSVQGGLLRSVEGCAGRLHVVNVLS